MFQEGRENVEDEPRPGRPSTSTTDENVEAVKEIVLKNRRITIREVAEDVGISVGSCHGILSDVLGMRRVSAKFVPKLLNFDQKNRRMTIAQEAGLRFYKIRFYKIKNPNTLISTHIHYYIHTIVLYRVVLYLVETNLVETKACRSGDVE